ncbi:MAG: hypothetical protein PHP92_04070 [Candidatus Nanoarchaeia archaeon]|nr:hypothetical protein [Candidatus Nanoarchaeia archaeon]
MDEALEIDPKYKELLTDMVFDFVLLSSRNLNKKTSELLVDVLNDKKIKTSIKRSFNKKELQRILFAIQTALKFHFKLNLPDSKPIYAKGNNEIH